MIKLGASHQHFAVLKPIERIGPEISRWVVVCVLHDAPKAPEIIAHHLVQHDPIVKSWRYKATTISLHHGLIFFMPEPSLHRKISKIPHRIVHPGILPIDDVEASAHL